MLPALRGGRVEPGTLYWEQIGNTAIRRGRFKLVRRARAAVGAVRHRHRPRRAGRRGREAPRRRRRAGGGVAGVGEPRRRDPLGARAGDLSPRRQGRSRRLTGVHARRLLDGGASRRSASHVLNGEGEPAMSNCEGRREAHGETRRGMSRRRLLGLGLLSAAAPAVLLRPTARGGADRRRPAGRAAPAGELKNPAEFKGPKVKASSPTTLSFWQYVGFHVDVQKFIAEEYKKRHDPEPLAGDHRVPRAERAAGGREVGAGGPEPHARHHRRRAGGLRRRRVHQRQRARLHQGLRRGSRLQAGLLAQRARAADDQRRDRLGARRHQHGDRLLQPRPLPPARPRGARTPWTS